MKRTLIVIGIVALCFGFIRWFPRQTDSLPKPPVSVLSVTFDGMEGSEWRTIWRFSSRVVATPGCDHTLVIVDRTHYASASSVRQFDECSIVCLHPSDNQPCPERWCIAGKGKLVFPDGDWNPVASGYRDNLASQCVVMP